MSKIETNRLNMVNGDKKDNSPGSRSLFKISLQEKRILK
jgi:hypothetical protein